MSNFERFAMQRGHDAGFKEGQAEGRAEEATRLLLRLLTYRFGEVAEALQARIHTLTLEQKGGLVDVALTS